uniref:Uncharacterized protein n=1 Tax=Knipowitschia caucasica TaxID=637954 RepID=A0AAV2KZ24_KNICA
MTVHVAVHLTSSPAGRMDGAPGHPSSPPHGSALHPRAPSSRSGVRASRSPLSPGSLPPSLSDPHWEMGSRAPAGSPTLDRSSVAGPGSAEAGQLSSEAPLYWRSSDVSAF